MTNSNELDYIIKFKAASLCIKLDSLLTLLCFMAMCGWENSADLYHVFKNMIA